MIFHSITSFIQKVLFFCSQLALKHRQGKNHRMRIVIFVGSPIEVVDKEVYNDYLMNKHEE